MKESRLGKVFLMEPVHTSPRLAVAASFTAEPLGEILAFWMKELGFSYEIRFAPYNQLFQQILDPGSLLGANRNGINLVLLRFEDWSRFGPERSLQDLEADVAPVSGSARPERACLAGSAHCRDLPAFARVRGRSGTRRLLRTHAGVDVSRLYGRRHAVPGDPGRDRRSSIRSRSRTIRTPTNWATCPTRPSFSPRSAPCSRARSTPCAPRRTR